LLRYINAYTLRMYDTFARARVYTASTGTH